MRDDPDDDLERHEADDQHERDGQVAAIGVSAESVMDDGPDQMHKEKEQRGERCRWNSIPATPFTNDFTPGQASAVGRRYGLNT